MTWIAAIAVFIGTLVVFMPAMHNDFIDWDDTDNFVRNDGFRGLDAEHLSWMFSTFHMGHYQPLTWLTLGVDYTWGGKVFGEHPTYGYGMDPRSYHLTNVILHAVNAALVFFLARLLIVLALPRANQFAVVAGAACAGLLFGVHPLRVESVAWATERRDLLSGLFLLLAVLSYLHGHCRATSSPRVKWSLIAPGCFVLSLLSKVMGVTLPVVLLILDVFPLRRLERNPARWLAGQNRRVLIEKIPYIALSVVFSLIATIGQGRNQWLVTLEMHGPFERIMQSMYGLVFYVWKTIIPIDLSPLYQMRMPLDVTQPRLVIAAIIVVVAAAALIAFRRAVPAVVAAALTYAIMVLPVLGLMQNGPQLVADRYSYLPCISVAVLAGGAAVLLLMRTTAAARYAAVAIAAIALAGLSWLTREQLRVWRDTGSFWTAVYQFDPQSAHAQNGYGYALLQQGRVDEAIELFRSAIQLQPQNEKAHHNLWDALRLKGDMAGLASTLESLMTTDSVATAAGYELGNLMLEQGDSTRAAAVLREVVQRDPSHLRARTNLGLALMRLNQLNESIDQLQEAVRLDPNFFPARYNLGLALRADGQTQQAIEQLRIAAQLRPDHVRVREALDSLTAP